MAGGNAKLSRHRAPDLQRPVPQAPFCGVPLKEQRRIEIRKVFHLVAVNHECLLGAENFQGCELKFGNLR